MDKNIREYILKLASECIFYIDRALFLSGTFDFKIAPVLLTESFYCAKKIEEIYYTRCLNTQLLNFSEHFNNLNKEFWLSYTFNSLEKTREAFKLMKLTYEQLETELSINE